MAHIQSSPQRVQKTHSLRGAPSGLDVCLFLNDILFAGKGAPPELTVLPFFSIFSGLFLKAFKKRKDLGVNF